MKKFYQVMICGILLISTVIVFSGCKKKSDTVTYPSVAFIVTYVNVTLDSGPGVQFYANCSSTDVKMTKVEILDPIHSGTATYNLNGTAYVKSQIFGLQDATTGYVKEAGTYQITFTGLRTADSAPFSIIENVAVSK